MIYPKFYHYDRWGSDRDFVVSRMSVIPEGMQNGVSIKYSNIVLKKGDNWRKEANTYLNDVANKCIKDKKGNYNEAHRI